MRYLLASLLLSAVLACSSKPVVYKRAPQNPFASAPSGTKDMTTQMTEREKLRPLTPQGSNVPPMVPSNVYPKAE